jgi:alkylation response protein AidB-like acyl-CoA dehydrogenase
MGMRMGVSMQACGIAERAYTLARDYAKDRIQFDKPIESFPGVANKLRGMEENISRMRKYAFEASYVLSRFQSGQSLKTKYLKLSPEEDKTLEEFSEQYNRGILNLTISKAKMFNSEVGWMITDDCLQIHGGNGFIRDYKVEKLLRDFRILRIYEGTSEIQEYIVNRTKNVGTASSINSLMELAMTQKGESGPVFSSLDYADLFYRRFPSVMDAYMDENGEQLFLFDE